MKKYKLFKLAAVTAVISCIGICAVIGANAAVIDTDSSSLLEIQKTGSLVSASSLPTKYSSRDLGYVTEVSNQKYNDCWAYAGLAVYESKLLSDSNSIGVMSADHLNLWATTRSNGTGWQRTINKGGYAETALGYLLSWQGGVEADVIGSVDLSGGTTADDLDVSLTEYGVTSVHMIDRENSDEIKQAIMDDGGVYAQFASSMSCYSSTYISYYMPSNYSGSYTGHAIEIVGWNDNYSKSNFKTINGSSPQSNGAWLCKGSWGSNFNDIGGYFWISYEDGFLLGEIYNACYSISDYEKITDDMRLEQNEIYGATYNFEYVKNSDIVYLNQFDFSNGCNTLDKVIFETKSIGADYSIYYVPIENSTPVSDKSSWIKLYDGVIEYNGYICADISDYELPLGYGAIGIEINTQSVNKGVSSSSSDYISNSLGVCEWLNSSDGGYTFINDSDKGDSFIYYNNSMYELLNWYKTYNNDDLGGTFVIKALTTGEGASVTLLGDVDLNDIINVRDATAVQKYLVDLEEFTEIKKLNADVNEDGVINVTDVTEIQRIIVNS